MRILPLDIAGAAILESDRHGDERGGFARWFCERELSEVLNGASIRQMNHSTSQQCGTVRGMHFQHAPQAEKKMIRCLAGRIFDVVLDLRAGSETFLQWRGVELSGDDDRALLIPEGCAHGFQTLSDQVQMLYLHTAFYSPELEAAVAYNDPRVQIAWPLPITVVSDRDRQHPYLSVDFSGITL